MPLFVVVLLKRTNYNKETKREAKNERRKNERSQNRDKKAITADFAPDPKSVLCTAILLLAKKSIKLIKNTNAHKPASSICIN